MIDTPCGFDDKFSNLLEEQFNKRAKLQSHGLLLIDEIGIRNRVIVYRKTMTLVGLADFGEDRTERTIDEKTGYVLDFLFQSLMDSYTQPIAVFTSNDPTHGNKLAQLVIQAVVKLEKAGAIVHGVISDGASSNRKMWTELVANAKMGKDFKKLLRSSF